MPLIEVFFQKKKQKAKISSKQKQRRQVANIVIKQFIPTDLITRNIKKILSYYESDNPGVKANLARILMCGKLGGEN